MFIKLLCVYCSLPLKEVTSQYKAVQSESWMLVGEQSANRNRATSKWESMLAVLKDLCWNTFTNQFGTTRQEIWIKVAQPEPTIQARWGKNISMISACDLIFIFSHSHDRGFDLAADSKHWPILWSSGNTGKANRRNSLSWRDHWCSNTCDPGGFSVNWQQHSPTSSE